MSNARLLRRVWHRTDCRVVQRDETYPVKGDPITVRAQVMVCNECGEDLFNARLDDGNLERAFQEYRRMKGGLLASKDIIAIREKYGLSQRGLAALLSWSPATVARYETGALPSVLTMNRSVDFGMMLTTPESCSGPGRITSAGWRDLEWKACFGSFQRMTRPPRPSSAVSHEQVFGSGRRVSWALPIRC